MSTYRWFLIVVLGHGKSEPFPPGLLISQLHIVDVIKKVTEHLKWKTFDFMAHSMGCVIGR